jgi:hypothetical protein
LRILNKSSYLDIFKGLPEYFKNQKILTIYQLLFCLTKSYLGNEEQLLPCLLKEVEQKEHFISFILEIIPKKSSALGGLGEFLKSLVKICEFSEDNILKLKEILDFYEIQTIEPGEVAKLCKTTGIVSFFVKDALTFCGLDTQKGKYNPNGSEMLNIAIDSKEAKSMKLLRENILSKLDYFLQKYSK